MRVLQPSTALPGAENEISVFGNIHAFSIELDEQETANILQALKKLGHTFTHLLEAAVALATFKSSPIPEDKAAIAHVTVNNMYVLFMLVLRVT